MSPRRRLRMLAAILAGPVLLLGAVVTGATVAGATGPTPGTVFVRTVPALGGIHLIIGSVQVTTRADGSANVRVSNINGVAARVLLASKVVDPRTSVTLATVKPEPHTVKYESHLELGLDVSSQVTLRVDPGHTGVSAAIVRVVRLHSVTGQTVLVDLIHGGTVSLPSRKSRLVANHVTSQVITWSVDSVGATRGVSLTTDRGRFDPFTDPLWTLLLRPVRGSVVVDTVPPTPGVSFLLDGASFTTDAQGRGEISVPDLNGVDAGLGLSTSQTADSSTVSVLRVTRLKPGAAFQRHLLAALAVRRPVSLSFQDPNGRPISTGRVSSVALEGGGATRTIKGDQLGDPVTLLAEQAKLVDGKWQVVPSTYSVTGVMLEGANAVFAGQQRFNPANSDSWPISLSVFDVGVTIRDVLFGAQISSYATLTRPDGVAYAVELGSGRPTELTALVRGQYTLDTQSAVVGGNASLLVSKDSQVELRVVTMTDAVVFLTVGLGLALSVVLIGRRVLGPRAERRSRHR